MITAIALTLMAIILGDAITMLLQLPVPGAIVGLLCARATSSGAVRPDPAMARTVRCPDPHAPILFVPAGAGVVANLDVIAGGLLAIFAVITLGTVATIARDRARDAVAVAAETAGGAHGMTVSRHGVAHRPSAIRAGSDFGVYAIATMVHERLGRPSMLHPVLSIRRCRSPPCWSRPAQLSCLFRPGRSAPQRAQRICRAARRSACQEAALIRAAACRSRRAFDRVCRCRDDSIWRRPSPWAWSRASSPHSRRNLPRPPLQSASPSGWAACRSRGDGCRSDGAFWCDGRPFVSGGGRSPRRARGGFRHRRGGACNRNRTGVSDLRDRRRLRQPWG